MSELTEAKIEELRGLDAAATKGPWKWDGDVCDGSQDYRDQNAPWLVTDDNLEIPILRGDITGSRDADAALIVAMRNALPALLDLAASSLARGGEGEGATDQSKGGDANDVSEHSRPDATSPGRECEPAGASDADRASDMLMEAADFIAATLAEADPRAWQHLLIYAPKPAGASEELCRRLEECEHKEGFICDPCSGSRVITIKPYNRDGTEAASLIRRLEREGSQWQERESETQEELQAIGEEFGAYGGEPRTDAMRRLLTETTARATTAEAEAESWKSQFHSAAEAASMYVEFYEQHHADFDPAGNYIPHSQIDGDLRAAKAEAERLRAERDELREKVERLEGERNALSAEMDQATGRIDDIGAEAKALRSENAALQEAVFRAEHRELVNAANWHKAAEDAKSGKWANLLARLEGMTAEERRAKVVLSMDKQREIRRARTALEGKTDGK